MGKVVSISDYVKKDDDNYIKQFENIIIECNNTDDIATKVACYSLYKEKRIIYQIAINKFNEQNNCELNSLGFMCTLDEYKDSKIIKDFIAKCMLEEIYSSIDLEEYLHKRFKSVEDLKNTNIKKYMVDAIYGYDNELHDYLMLNLDLTNEMVKEFEYVIKRWAWYEKASCIDIEEIYEFVCDFTENYECNWTPEELLHYMKLEMGIDCTQVIDDLITNLEDSFDYSLYDNDEEVNLTYMQDLFKTNVGRDTFKNCNIEDYRALFVFKNEIEEFLKGKKLPEECYVKPKKLEKIKK